MDVQRPVHFSARTSFGEQSDGLMADVAERRRRGLPVLDLTDSNPTRCGVALPASVVLPPLADDANLHYRGEPCGSRDARAAVAELYYAPRRVAVDPDHLFLTASTSEAYSYLFRLLCEPGDQVLVPEPSYPLFDLLARLNDVELRPYPLRFHDRWQTDFHTLEAAITGRTRAVILVHPNNPTGHYLSPAEKEAVTRIALRHGLALIADEVFLDYRVEAGNGSPMSLIAGEAPPVLTFAMSGLSKVLALPQMKVAWTVVAGPPDMRDEALRRLEVIADTFLSVASPGSHALAHWLEQTQTLQGSISRRVRANLALADDLIEAQTLVTRLPVEGGWSVILRCPAWETDDRFARLLLEATGVLVHPGSFFGLPPRGFVVASLLLPEEHFADGITRLLSEVKQRAVSLE